MVVIALMLWPFVHQQLTQAYLVSPWKLCGWAMYCVPSAQSFQVLDHEGRTVDLAQFDQNTQILLDGFARHHHGLGLLASPRKSAHAIGKARPDYDTFIIRVEKYGFDDKSYLNVVHRVNYHCHVERNGEITIKSEVITFD